MRFLDTSVLLRHLVDDIPDQSNLATELLLSIESGKETVYTTPLVISEVIFTLHRFYKLPLADVRDRIMPLVHLPGIRVEQKDYFDRALDLAVEKNIDFPNAFSAVYMQANGLSEIYSWDHHFDRVDGIQRIEPGSTGPA